MWPQEKHISRGLKGYREHILNSKIYISKHFICPERISKNYFKIKDLVINNYYCYAHVVWPPQENSLYAAKIYKKNILKSSI